MCEGVGKKYINIYKNITSSESNNHAKWYFPQWLVHLRWQCDYLEVALYLSSTEDRHTGSLLQELHRGLIKILRGSRWPITFLQGKTGFMPLCFLKGPVGFLSSKLKVPGEKPLSISSVRDTTGDYLIYFLTSNEYITE